MLDILRSYRETKRQTSERKKKLEIQYAELQKCETLTVEDAKKAEEIKQDISIMNAALSDMTYIISWITTGRRPGATRGIERQSVYKREITFDDRWLDLFIDENVSIHEIPEPDPETLEMKAELVEDLKEYLTPKQLEVFVMLAEGLEQTEIAAMLGVSKQAVNELVVKGRQRINKAGWVLV